MAYETMANPGVERVQRQGLCAVGILAAASILGFPVSWLLPPPAISIVIVAALGAVIAQVVLEYRASDPGHFTPVGRRWLMHGLAVALAVPAVLISRMAEELASAPPACGFPTPGDSPDICFITTHAETVGFTTWTTVMAVMAVVFVACVLVSDRAQIAVWASTPIVAAACTLAFDISHAAVVLVGRGSP